MQIESIVIVATIAGICPPCTKYFGKMKDVFPRQVRDIIHRNIILNYAIDNTRLFQKLRPTIVTMIKFLKK